MADEQPTETPSEGEMVPPIMDYPTETEEAPPVDEPTTPPSEDGSSIVHVPDYPAPRPGGD
ncbi:hypothetical protein [Streptomyces sp. NPDC056291]|uniref:hypothetical protein n=1 Tax=Streptomyces sp. NPDC056291 TaxID=3345772 RepID=UPI0035D6D09B